jgi:hypothetical protein
MLVLLTQQAIAKSKKSGNPLASYSEQWNAATYNSCNTAAKASYLTAEEKELIWILNMARANPEQFAMTVVKPYSERHGIDMDSKQYYKTLMKQMLSIAPLSILQPDKTAFISAECHAVSGGKSGYVGHSRQSAQCKKVQKYNGECCSYGVHEPVGIIVTLLVDEDVPSLGHRMICLGDYTKVATAIRPHKGYDINAVLDFLR